MIGHGCRKDLCNLSWNIIDVRDLCVAHMLAAKSHLDHVATEGGARYIMRSNGGPERRPETGGSSALDPDSVKISPKKSYPYNRQ
jgi:hypothetical protein